MWQELLQASLFILFSALFSASEVSLFSIPREEIHKLRKGSIAEKRIYNLLEKGEETLIAILLGNIFVNISVVGVVGRLIVHYLGDSQLYFFLGTTLVLVVLGEILPKAVALSAGRTVILVTAPFLLFVRSVLKPLIAIFSKINRTLLRWNYLFLLSSPSPFVTTEEYISALDRAAENNQIGSGVSSFMKEMSDIVDFPLNRVVIHRTQLESHPRFKIDLTESGAVQSVYDREKECELKELFWLPVTKSIGDVMKYFRESGNAIAMVHNEYGDFHGIATRSSLINYMKALYGNSNSIANTIVVHGSDPIANYLDWLDEDLLEEFPDIRSVGGLVAAMAESIPLKGSVLESQSCIFEIIQAEQNSIVKLKITRK